MNIVSISGGLGNQMFQYAFYLSLKNKKSFGIQINSLYLARYNKHNGYELDQVFGLRKHRIVNIIAGFIKKYFKIKTSFVKENYFHPDSQERSILRKPITYYCGYWQSEKYFIDIEDKIRQTFRFNYEKLNTKSKTIYGEIVNSNSVSIHIRRGDYENNEEIKSKHGGICTFDYYFKAVEFICSKTNNPTFYIFSDDTNWVKENFTLFKNKVIIDWNHKLESWQDMMLMSLCKHNIIANSTFSWWGAWLNENPFKIVIAPSRWFNIGNEPEIIPSNWITMN